MHQEPLSPEKGPKEKALLVALELPARSGDGWTAAESLDELERLVDTAGAVVVGRQVQQRPAPDPATYIGRGKAGEIEELRRALEFDLVVFDNELTPVQQRNLEEIIQCRVLDRTAVILDIFAQRARTREARLQVELAQHTYLLPRLTGRGAAMSRLGSGGGRSVGIGTRGPGETKLETDRRRIRERIAALRRELEEVRAHRTRLRQERAANAIPVVALAGYTNAGKSTLHRALTGSDVLAEDRLFATLDPTTRRVNPAEGEPYLLVDTVGFIHNLPTFLVAAFRSTLEEVADADLILHVVDAAHPKRAEQMQTVVDVLRELGAGEKPTLTVYNKADLLPPAELQHLLAVTPDAVAVSATRGDNLDGLRQEIQQALSRRRELVEVLIPYDQSGWVAWAHQRGRVLAEDHRAEGTYLKVELERGLAGQLKAAFRPQ